MALVVLSVLALLIWGVARPALPLSFVLAPWPTEDALLGWAWQIDQTNWQLTGIVLWLTLSGALYQAALPAPDRRTSKTPEWQRTAAVAFLPVALFLVLWAATPATFLTGWTIFVGLSLAIVQAGGGMRRVAAGGRWLLPLLFYSLAVALGSTTTGRGLVSATWPPAAVGLALLAAGWQMAVGFWPRHPSAASQMPAAALLLRFLPALSGVLLLARLVAVVAIPQALLLLATLCGMVAILAGVWLAWGRPAARTLAAEAIRGLFLALAGVALLSGVWAGPATLVAATRLMILAPAALFLVGAARPRGAQATAADGGPQAQLTPHLPRASRPLPFAFLFHPHVLTLALVFLALAGLPPTVGFAAVAPLYNLWNSGIHVVLILPLLLMIMLLLATVYRFAQSVARRPATAGSERSLHAWTAALAPLLLASGLLALSGSGAGAGSLIAWLALFATALGGLALPHIVGQSRALRRALRESLSFRPLPGELSATVNRLQTAAANAFSDAYAILEGDGGLLWLLGLLLLFWWIS